MGKELEKGSDQIRSVTQSCPTLCNPVNCSTPGLPVHHQLQSSLRLTSVESVMPSSHLILCCPLLLLPPIPPSIRVFSNESALRMRWPKYWSFSFSIIWRLITLQNSGGFCIHQHESATGACIPPS